MHGLYFIALVAVALFSGVALPLFFAKAEEQREREGRALSDDDHDREPRRTR
jgi:hypothetical protein